MHCKGVRKTCLLTVLLGSVQETFNHYLVYVVEPFNLVIDSNWRPQRPLRSATSLALDTYGLKRSLRFVICLNERIVIIVYNEIITLWRLDRTGVHGGCLLSRPLVPSSRGSLNRGRDIG